MATHSGILPRESHGQRSLVGYSPWGHKELDTTEQLTHFQQPLQFYLHPSYLLSSLVAQRLSICLQCGRPGFDPWVGKISQRRKWQPTPVFLPGESFGQRSLVGYSPLGHKESDTTERLHFLSFFLSGVCCCGVRYLRNAT